MSRKVEKISEINIGDIVYLENGENRPLFYAINSIGFDDWNGVEKYSQGQIPLEEVTHPFASGRRLNGNSNTYTFSGSDVDGISVFEFDEYKVKMKEIVDEKLKSIKIYADMAKEVYGDRAVTTEYNGVLCTFLHFPETLVTSENGLKTTVYDMVFKIRYSTSTNSMSSISAQVYTISKDKLAVNYSHSHLPGGSVYGWDIPCFGATNLDSTVNDLKMGLSESEFMLMLIELKDYVEYESIAGGPYCSISSIGRVDSIYIDSTTVKATIQDMLSKDISVNIESIQKDGYISGKINEEELSNVLVKNVDKDILVPYIGLMTNGIFHKEGNNTVSDSTIREFTSRAGLSVSDGTDSIRLDKTITEGKGEEKHESKDYIYPLFLKEVSNILIANYEDFINIKEIEK